MCVHDLGVSPDRHLQRTCDSRNELWNFGDGGNCLIIVGDFQELIGVIGSQYPLIHQKRETGTGQRRCQDHPWGLGINTLVTESKGETSLAY